SELLFNDRDLSASGNFGQLLSPFVLLVSEVSKTEGRVGQTTNVVIGGTVTDDSTDEWLTLDQKVSIGTDGDDFVQSMIVAVESVLQQPIPEVSSTSLIVK
ncbi:hypothetical protein V2J09_018715, partial [Rumex salicifolius]